MALSFLRKPALAATTVLLAGAALAGVAAPAHAAPSSASGYCHVSGLGGDYICEYGEAWLTYPDGGKQVFIVGSDFGVWTRWGSGGSWYDWTSLGGVARSGVRVDGNGTWTPTISVIGNDGDRWYRHRLASGTWTNWSK
ncbi:hypothetical protein [Streptomyces sp. NPDC018045]|uniref:hypothetical protein n=1 Tax=Streptomyces sp. NPDC018045 TaxID=3365037 RepID=UPI00378D6A2C